MKKITSLLIACSLALAGAAFAQQPDESASPGAKPGEKKHAGEAKPGANAEKPHAGEAKAGANAGKQHTDANAAGGAKAEATPKAPAPASATTSEARQTTASATPAAKEQGEQHGKGKGHGANAKASPSASPAASASTSTSPATAASASAAPSTAAGSGQANAGGGAKKRPDPQQVQQIKAQHASFRAQPKPQQVPAVTFSQNYRIQGAEQWQGPQYEVFRSYHPERHDQGWYRAHYPRVELIAGGYYYFNAGYWYPAWGYSPQAEYYAYDAPIYVGQRAEPPDRVIADVQATLQQMGYYKGEVDGLIGPLTREALTAYQSSQGLVATAVIDQPTLDSLGMG